MLLFYYSMHDNRYSAKPDPTNDHTSDPTTDPTFEPTFEIQQMIFDEFLLVYHELNSKIITLLSMFIIGKPIECIFNDPDEYTYKYPSDNPTIAPKNISSIPSTKSVGNNHTGEPTIQPYELTKSLSISSIYHQKPTTTIE
eukprot:135562_1